MSEIADVYEEFIVKLTNTLQLSDGEGNSINVSEEDLEQYASSLIERTLFGAEYAALFDDVKKFKGTNHAQISKLIYTHRAGITSHPRCTREIKHNAWLQALGNMESLEESNPVFEAWKNVLSSRFAYHVMMDSLPASNEFNKAIIRLIQEPLTMKLCESALYPISFLFMPTMLGFDNFKPADNCFGVSKATYSKHLQEVLRTFGDPAINAFDYKACNWLYFLDKTGRQYMLALLHQSFTTVAEKKETKQDSENGEEADGEDNE